MNESTVTITVADGVMHVAGEIDMYSATCLDSALADVGCPQLVDMSAVSFMDCAGLNALTRHHRRRVEQGEALRVVAMSRAVERVLEVSGLLPMLAAESATAA